MLGRRRDLIVVVSVRVGSIERSAQVELRSVDALDNGQLQKTVDELRRGLGEP